MDASLSDVLCRVRGRVQGVGFRPFVRRRALALGLSGWVRNDGAGVLLRVRGEGTCVGQLVDALRSEAPGLARVETVACEAITGEQAVEAALAAFPILESELSGESLATQVPVEAALCEECRRELFDPVDRRYRYPFITCTQCGPRYSIIESMPYDRERTTMRCFRLCPACKAEYEDPASRRYHAEPVACPQCGPFLLFHHAGQAQPAERRNWLEARHEPARVPYPEAGEEALTAAVQVLLAGGIVAVKGLGGYHLLCDASRAEVVQTLRRRKHRDEKPLAVLFPSLAAVECEADLVEEERQLLRSPEAPIVLVRRRPESRLPSELAPENPWLGALLPYTPVHELLLRAVGRPLVATSANLSEEPLCFEDEEARRRLGGIADAFLFGDRGIVHPVDDSVLRVTSGKRVLRLRLARGYAPLELELPEPLQETVLCLGADMKASVAVAQGRRLVQGPQVGDLANAATQAAFVRCQRMLSERFAMKPTRVVCDLHPGYHSTRLAEQSGLPVFRVQHHLAHFLACLLEHRRSPEGVLGVVWDGTGYGPDGCIWGGEFLLGLGGRVERFAHLRPFSLPGGDAAAHDPRRAAHAMYLESGDVFTARCGRAEWLKRLALTPAAVSVLEQMLTRGLNTVRSTSMGRLFDVAAWLCGVGSRNHFEGQLPLALEALASRPRAQAAGGMEPLAFPLRERAVGADGARRCVEMDWAPAFEALAFSGRRPEELAWAFHAGLAKAVVDLAQRAQVRTVALSGGCFQNALLTDLVCSGLEEAGLEVLLPRDLPSGDGGIAAGQAYAALLGLGDVTLAS